ncbi:protein FAM24B isoform X3 [Pongo abelii]|uniref:protein FAM24B isoform X3 n=1 Tax=Pongo abelii TaxID=9601 RepID=UPI0023E8394C|nr:protein FAM24B isoform X3 [Pongo abelii]
MSCSLKFTLIVVFFYCWLSSSHEELEGVIILVIAGGILAALLLLIVVVLCLYFKIHNALKAAKEPEAVAVKNHNPDKVWWAKNSQAKTIAAECCPALQCREGCRMCAGFGSLPPCCCDINEGL